MNTADNAASARAQASPSVPVERPSPLLSIGLPVYNGSKHLGEAIDSLLAQDIGDFELIISDNASTDDTPRICMGYAAVDSRVSYSRNEANTGGAANYNRVFGLSSGEYFMWGSDDDVWDPRFARLCLDRLEKSPNAVLCAGQTALIGEDGEVLRAKACNGLDTEGMPVEARIHEMIRRLAGYDVYGVIRASALRKTNLFMPTFGPDTRLVLELLLIGETLTVPEVLFYNRTPPAPKTSGQYVSEIDPNRANLDAREEFDQPLTFLARELLKTVEASRLDAETIRRIEEDLVDTLSFDNHFWRKLILDEQGLSEDGFPTCRAKRTAIREALKLDASFETSSCLAAPRNPWTMRDGMRLSAMRKLLLRILQPFVDSQNQADEQIIDTLGPLDCEFRRLQTRVHELERREGRRSNREAAEEE